MSDVYVSENEADAKALVRRWKYVATPAPHYREVVFVDGLASTGEQLVYAATAGQNLSGDRAVVLDDSGEAVYASNDDLTHLGRRVFLTAGAALDGDDVDLISEGPVVEGSWSWTPGEPLYLGAGGALTQVAPSSPAEFSLLIGYALAADTIFFDPKMPIRLIA